MIHAIIFDCFGVLAEDGWLPFKRHYIGDDTALEQEIADLGKQNEHGLIDNQTHARKVSQRLGVSQETYLRAVGRQVPNQKLFSYIQKHLRPYFKIGLLSNANYDVLSDLFTAEQAALIDASALSYECRLIKPDPRMYHLIAERLGVASEACVYIDDVIRYCSAAQDVGMQTIAHTSNNTTILAIEQITTPK